MLDKLAVVPVRAVFDDNRERRDGIRCDQQSKLQRGRAILCC